MKGDEPTLTLPGTAAAEASIDLSGRTLAGRYRVDARIGAGGMGTVYAAWDEQSGLRVAIKRLKPNAATPTALRRMRREAKAALSARHAHICQVFAFGIDEGMAFIVMEHLEGETLRERIAATGQLALSDALSVMVQLLSALEAAHASGVMHRDVKPSNVFLTSARGEIPSIRLIDFGLAKQLPKRAHLEEETALTATNAVPGTLQYLAPEQLAGANIDERVDVWAAGLTLFEMLAGYRLYPDRPDVRSVLADILYSPPVPLAELRPDVPAALDVVLRRALAKSPADRFPSARAFKEALVEGWARHRAHSLLAPASGAAAATSTSTRPATDDADTEVDRTRLDDDVTTIRQEV